jgi:hypothetical protein
MLFGEIFVIFINKDMTSISDNVFAQVCLDERVSDGIFRMDEEAHMDALRDYLTQRGITPDVVREVTNRMLEGNYPARQAWRKEDGILVTWPSPKHKKLAFKKYPGKYTDQEPKKPEPVQKEPKKDPIQRIGGEKEEPDLTPKSEPSGDEPKKEPNIFDAPPQQVSQGGQRLSVEPIQPQPVPKSPTVPVVPRTPERIAAEKEVVKQMVNVDPNSLSNFDPAITEESQKVLRHQLQEIYNRCEQWGFQETIKFLTPYVKT